MAKAFYAKMIQEMQAIRKFLSVQQLDIDEWKYEQLATVFQPTRDFDGPIVITSILAVFPSTTTSAVINLGAPGRLIPIPLLPPPGQSVSASGSVVTPGANALIAGVSVGPGTYQITWDVEIATAVAANPDNFRVAVNGGATTYATSENGTAIGDYPNQLPTVVVATGGIQTIGVYSILADATATYKATIVATPVQNAQVAATPGLFLADDLRIQCGKDDFPRNMVIAPAGAGYINFFGYADKMIVDHS